MIKSNAFDRPGPKHAPTSRRCANVRRPARPSVRKAPHSIEQLEERTLLTAIIGMNFLGSTFGVQSGFIPPDTDGAIGPSHFVEMINGRFRVYDKATGSSVQSKSLDQFWTDAGAAATGGSFDPRVIFDHASSRWFATALDFGPGGSNPNDILLAVSTSSDPTAAWKGFKFVANPSTTLFADYPGLGVDADGVYVSVNNFAATFVSVTIASFPKSDLLLATPTIANRTVFQQENASNRGFAIQPIVDFGPSDSRGALLAHDANVFNLFNRTNVLGAGAGGATLSASADIAVTSSNPPLARQPDGTQNLNANDFRIATTVFEQGSSLWSVHGINVGGRAAIRWEEISEVTNAVLQSGTISDATVDMFYPSIAVNSFGEVVIGFSASSPTAGTGFASSYAIAGTTNAGVTTFGSPFLLKQGVNNYHLNDGSGRNRWGDYSATTRDPNDPHSFWTIQEWASGLNIWSTQITQLMFPGTSGNIVLNGTGLDDTLTITMSGPAAGTYTFNANPAVSFSGCTSFTFNGNAGNDLLVLNEAAATLGSACPITYNGGTNTAAGDRMTLSGGSVNTVIHAFTNANDGSVTIDPDGGSTTNAGLVTYTGLEPVTDGIATVNRVFTFNTGTSDTITLVDAAGPNMTIDASTSEAVTFSNPTGSLTINAGAQGDFVSVNSVDANGPFNASLTINGDAGNDAVDINTSITFAANNNLDVDLQNDAAAGDVDIVRIGTSATANLRASGTGTITAKASFNVIVFSGSSLEVVNGNLVMEGNQQAVPTSGGFIGARVIGGLVRSSGTGNITIRGRGGDFAATSQMGVLIESSGVVESTSSAAGAGTITIGGTGGPGTTINYGVRVTGASSRVTSVAGNIAITGTGGAGTGAFNGGVIVDLGGAVRSTGTGANAANIAITGMGGTGTNIGVGVHVDAATVSTVDGDVTLNGTGAAGSGNFNIGVDVFSATGVVSSTGTGASAGTITIMGTGGGGTDNNAGVFIDGGGRVTSVDGAVQITGTATDTTGAGQNGVHFETGGALTTTGTATTTVTGTATGFGIALLNPSTFTFAGATNTLVANSMSIDTTGATIIAGGNTVALRQNTNGTTIDLGGADAASTLGLTDAELDRITAGTIAVGNANSGAINLTADLSQPGKNLTLTSGAGVTGPAAITNGSATATTVTVNQSGDSTYSGQLGGPSGGTANDKNLSLVKLGTGTFTISGTNTYTGVTTISAGTLLVTGSTAAASAASVGGTATLGGTGSVGGSVSVATSGTLAPGTSAGMLSTGNVTLESGSTFAVEVNGATPGSGHDQLNVTGTVTINGATLSTSGTIASSPGQQFVLIANDGGDAVMGTPGTFSGFAEGATVTINSVNFTISYVGGAGGNDVVLTESVGGGLGPPTDVNPATNAIAEGAANSSTVGITIQATGAVSYMLTGNAGGRFAIDSSTGVVTVADGSLLNFETSTSHTITVQASDGVGGTTSADFTINVTNVNPTAPADANGAANSVAEGAANGSTVGVTASSTDPNGPAASYSLTNSAGGRFAINASTGVVAVADGSLLNFESATSHTITVQASDGSGGTSTTDFTINVTNLNPSTPVDSDGAANAAATGAANGSTVGITVSATDPNGPAVSYSLRDDAGGRFAIHPATGVVTVANGAPIDGAVTYTITVLASDGAGGTSTASFTINDGNTNPIVAGLAVTSATNENGTVTLTGNIIDPDAANSFTLTITWGDGAPQVVALPAGTTSFSVMHQYLDDNPTASTSDVYTIRVDLQDSAGGSAPQASVQTTVRNVAPVSNIITGPSAGIVGQSLCFAGSFTDVGTLDTHRVQWNFGDSSPLTPPPFVATTDPGALAPCHVWSRTGTFTVRMTIRDDDGGAKFSTKTVVIRSPGILSAVASRQPSARRPVALFGAGARWSQLVLNPQRDKSSPKAISSVTAMKPNDRNLLFVTDSVLELSRSTRVVNIEPTQHQSENAVLVDQVLAEIEAERIV